MSKYTIKPVYWLTQLWQRSTQNITSSFPIFPSVQKSPKFLAPSTGQQQQQQENKMATSPSDCSLLLFWWGTQPVELTGKLFERVFGSWMIAKHCPTSHKTRSHFNHQEFGQNLETHLLVAAIVIMSSMCSHSNMWMSIYLPPSK